MSVIHKIDNEHKLIITTWEGDAIDNDFIEALKKYQNDIQNKPDYLDYNEIVNLKKMPQIWLSIKGLKDIGKIASSTDHCRGKTKLAIIVNTNLALKFVKLYTRYRNYSGNTNKKIRAFKNESDALYWACNNA